MRIEVAIISRRFLRLSDGASAVSPASPMNHKAEQRVSPAPSSGSLTEAAPARRTALR